MKSAKNLIADIRPLPVKDRSSLGKVTLHLEETTQITAVGVIYGLEHTLMGEGFTAKIFLDQYNQRIKVTEYEATDYDAMLMKVRKVAEANNFDKIIFMAARKDFQRLLTHGYVLEAVLKYYLNGNDAYVCSKFRSQERLTSHNLMDEVILIEDVMGDPVTTYDPPKELSLPEGYVVSLAKTKDIPELIELYQSIFETYPSPLIHADYLEAVFAKEAIFVVAKKDGRIMAAASGEIYPQQRSVELTDCATHPEARGLGLMSYLLEVLAYEFHQRDYQCAYTMARARSFGMNKTFHRLGYEFMGRLVNNCDIYGAYEDMNIWVRNLKDSPPSPLSYQKGTAW